MIHDSKFILVGKILCPHGIKGRVVIQSFTDPIANLCALPLLNSSEIAIHIKLYNITTKNKLICSIKGIDDRTSAEQLSKSDIFCLKTSLPNIENEDEFYIEALKERIVIDKNLNQVGIVKNFCNFGAGDIIEIQLLNDKSYLFPFTKTMFPEITDDYILINKVVSEILQENA